MSGNDDSKITLSRRKALAGIGTIGAAGALGLGGTYAQFTDTEGTKTTFTAGKIDGTMEWSASYNGNQVSGDLANVTMGDETAGIAFNLTDVKPGDYGSITFDLTVSNNPAWAASCLGYDSDENGTPESETEAEFVAAGEEDYGSGELEENLLLIPFYSQGPNTFFDSNGEPDDDWTPGDMGEYGQGTSAAFWNSREGENDFGDLQPRTLRDAATNASSIDTCHWNEENGLVVVPGPEGASVEEGCVLLEGNLAGENPAPENNNDNQGVSPLQPGETLSFGYDWHLPYTTGNEVQTDKLTMKLGFTFSQVRHSDAPQFQNSYDPGNYTPNGSDD